MNSGPTGLRSGAALSVGHLDPGRGIPSARLVLTLVLAYLGIHVVIRCLLSSSVDLDESHQVLFSQWLSWGYGPDPPLYTWVQRLFFSLFGTSIFPLAVLKNLLIFCIYLFTYLNARTVTRDSTCAVAAALSVLFIPQIAWESQRDLTHTILGSVLAALTLFTFLWLNERRTAAGYVIFGLVTGLGLLSKFNYVIWLVGLLGAALVTPQFRPTLTDKRLVLGLAACILVVLPYGLWALRFHDLAFENAQKLRMSSSTSWLGPALKGLENVAVAVPSFLGPLAAIYCAVFWKAPSRTDPQPLVRPFDKLLLRAFMIVLGTVLLLVVCVRATGFRERWFQPMLISAPVLAAALVRNRMTPTRLRWIAVLAGIVMLVVGLAIPGRILFGEKLGREEPLMRPYKALAAQLRSAYPEAVWIVADPAPTPGNLRLHLPEKPVFSVDTARLFPDARNPFLAVWDARKSDAIPKDLRAWLENKAITVDPAQVRFFEATYKYHRSRQMRLAATLLGTGNLAAGSESVPGHLRCEYRVDPVGLDVSLPRLSWVVRWDQRGQKQTSYRILAASSPENLNRDKSDLWDSGTVHSDQTIQVAYAGQPLRSRMRVWWKVRVVDKDGQTSAWSAPATWTMGLLQPSDWQAKWIADPVAEEVLTTLKPGADNGALPATFARKSFTLSGPIRRATAYATALGLYELRLNGQRVGEDLLAPEWTSYGKRVQYQVYDVTGLLREEENTAAAIVGEGWYAGRLMVVGRFAYGTNPRFLLQLEVEFADGRTQTIVSDGSWRCTTDGPIRSAGIYDGEVYDARKEMPGWDAPGFDAASWKPAQSLDLDSRLLVWQRNEPIRVVKELPSIRLTEPKPGTYVFDLGQNMVGWCRVLARGAACQTVTIRHAEMLNDDGTIYTANLRGAPQIDRYTPRADGSFTFEPRLTYHGFRYVELTGLARPPSVSAVVGRVFHSSAPVVARFECSEPSLNQLMQNILWTQRANLMSSPNDCPQRDERFGWMGDIQAFSQTAIFNMDVAAFFTKFAQDIRDDQAEDGRFPDFAPHPGDPGKSFSGAPAWADAGVIVPWRAYQNYADTRLLADHFEAARRWVDFIHQNNPDLTWAKNRGNDYNDWLNGNWVKQTGWPEKGGAVPNVVFATAFFAHSTELVSRIAEVLGRKEEARSYGELFTQIKRGFNDRFVQPDGRIEGDTQAGYALALNFNLLPEDLRPEAVQHLVENIHRYQDHLSTGIQTTHRAMLELARNNYTDLGWHLLTNRSFPSWLYMIDNGATTIWERWDGYVKGRGFQDAGMNSFNHWAFGAVGEWMWRHIAGLNPDDTRPGWKHFLVAPHPGGGVTWARTEYESIRGRIACSWNIADGKLRLQVTVPPNTTASIRVPTTDPSQITESGRVVSPGSISADSALFEVESGAYDFLAPWKQ